MIETRLQALLSAAVGRTERLSAWNEVFALVLLFAGTLLFFALISYTPNDIPSWLWFSHVSPANHPAQNFIGPLGAIIAGICYQLIGVFASLLLAAVLLGFGAAKLFYPRLRFVPRIPWIILFLISGACIDQAWGISTFPREDSPGRHSRAGRPHWVSLVRRTSRPASCRSRPGRFGSSRRRSLFDHADFGYGFAPDSSCSRDGQSYSPERREAGRMASAPENSEVGSHGTTQDAKATTSARGATEAT